MGESRDLARGRAAGRRLAWADAYAALSRVDPPESLTGEDLEVLAAAAYLVGKVTDCRQALQRAHKVHMRDGETPRAARSLFWVAFTLLLEGDLAQASGWLARTQRVLERVPEDCPERGLLLLPVAVQALGAGNYPAAQRAAADAAEVGARAADSDLLALALHFQGRALVLAGQVPEGLVRLDEAMVAVVAGEVWPPVAGNLYCSMIDACQEMSDVRRAHEWTEALGTWWRQQPQMITFTGQCLVHRAELLQLHGAWAEAAEEARHARERLAHAADQHATGAALYRQAELHRAVGAFAAAEDAYREASQWGQEPVPGLALLLVAQGRTEAAAAASRRAVAETTDRLRRAKLLPAHVEIMLAAGDVTAARHAAGELADIAAAHGAAAMHAAADHALGAVLLDDGDARGALVPLRRSWQAWQKLDAPYEAARVRVLIALGCRELGDDESAALELEAARRIFTQLGAAPDLARVQTLSTAPDGGATHGLSARELQVLRLVVTGRSNRAIAADLVLAEKTVDRHLTNIFGKLGVSSRTAATAYAYEHHLLAP